MDFGFESRDTVILLFTFNLFKRRYHEPSHFALLNPFQNLLTSRVSRLRAVSRNTVEPFPSQIQSLFCSQYSSVTVLSSRLFMVIINILRANQLALFVVDFNRVKSLLGADNMERSFKTTTRTIEPYVLKLRIVPKPETLIPTPWTTRIRAFSQRRIVDTCPSQISSFTRRIMLDISEFDPVVLPSSATLIRRHQCAPIQPSASSICDPTSSAEVLVVAVAKLTMGNNEY